MGSDEPALLRLWQEKGRRDGATPTYYSNNLLVQLGLAIEPLNRQSYERTTGQVIQDVQSWLRHPVCIEIHAAARANNGHVLAFDNLFGLCPLALGCTLSDWARLGPIRYAP
jgi:hypothetical protein